MQKTIYNYSPDTGAYINDAVADASPLEPDVVLVPAFATTIKPPKTDAREVAVFADGQWRAKADWRGVTLFSITDGSPVSIADIGVTPADVGATDQPIPSPAHSWAKDSWQLDPVKVAAHLTAAKKSGLELIDAYGKAQRVKIAGTSDEIEIAGWANKLATAKAIKAGSASESEKAAFQTESAGRNRGDTVDTLADKVIRNADFYLQASCLIDGLKRRAQDSVNAAKTPEEVDAVLAAMKSQAEAAFAQLMGATK